MRTILSTLALLLAGLSAAAFGQVSSNGPVIVDYGRHITAPNPTEARLAKEVRHELLMLPWYTLFDDLEFSVQDRTVTLSGYVTSIDAPTKDQAGGVVKHIEGVDEVKNDIVILPPNPLDDEVREQTYAAISRTASLSRYFWEAAPSIHIIVKNQRVVLRGIVNNETDKHLATIAANTVPGVFQVTNELHVEK